VGLPKARDDTDAIDRKKQSRCPILSSLGDYQSKSLVAFRRAPAPIEACFTDCQDFAMTDDDQDEFPGLTPLSEGAWDRFEEAWSRGECPRIEQYVRGFAGEERRSLLAALVGSDIEHRRRRGERPNARDYLDRFPGEADVIRSAFGRPPRADLEAARPPVNAGRNLLFGVLALQNNFISRDDLLAAFAAWVGDKSNGIAQLLVDRGALDEARRALLEALCVEHLKQHGDDPEASLASVSSLGPVRDDLVQLEDADLHASLLAAASRPARDSAETTATYGSSPRHAGDRFRILRFHREGGLGRVYIASDEELGRQVALKEIRPDKIAEGDLRSRFVLEAEINGGLEHPGIVPVYSLGTYDDGRPFYAMRFVEGDSLKEAIESYHKKHPRPDPTAVEFRKLLGRFIDVCEAIAFAHSKGVLHRDLKPNNVMLGRFGETLLIDWGLAKATGRREPVAPEVPCEATLIPPSGTGHAPTLGVLGSPPYMSPEQAAGEAESLGPATDIYGLGAILFALLTGDSPVEGGAVDDVLDRARRGAVRPPRTLNANVPRALEAICQKALAPKPEERYATARALADDVERWLADEPVSARADSLWTFTWRWIRKHRTLAATVAAALLVGIISLSAAYRRETAYASKLGAANLQINSKNRELEAANDRLDKANKESERWLGEAFQSIEDYYTGVGESIGRERSDLADLRRKLLEKPRAFYERLATEYSARSADDRRASAWIARGRVNLGNILVILGQHDQARSQLQSAIPLLEKLVAEQPEHTEYRFSLAESHSILGISLYSADRLAEAEAHYAQAISNYQALIGRHSELVKHEFPLAKVYSNLGEVLLKSGRRGAAEEAFVKAISRLDKVIATHPDLPFPKDRLASACINVGNVMAMTGRHSDAEKAYARAVDAAKSLVERYPNVGEYKDILARSYSSLGHSLRNTGRISEAVNLAKTAIELRQKVIEREPNVAEYRRYIGLDYHQLGISLWALGRNSEADEALSKAIAAEESLVALQPDVPDLRAMLAGFQMNRGLMLARSGRLTEAERTLTSAIATHQVLLAQQPRRNDFVSAKARAVASLGEVMAARGFHETAVGHFRAAISVHRTLFDREPNVPEFRKFLLDEHRSLVESLIALRRLDDALEAARERVKLGRGAEPVNIYNGACAIARCVSIAVTPARERAVADEAMAALREAVSAGYANAIEMNLDKDLQALRRRADFQALIAELFDRYFPAKPFAE
jgi:serine/threonine protein kinase